MNLGLELNKINGGFVEFTQFSSMGRALKGARSFFAPFDALLFMQMGERSGSHRYAAEPQAAKLPGTEFRATDRFVRPSQTAATAAPQGGRAGGPGAAGRPLAGCPLGGVRTAQSERPPGPAPTVDAQTTGPGTKGPQLGPDGERGGATAEAQRGRAPRRAHPRPRWAEAPAHCAGGRHCARETPGRRDSQTRGGRAPLKLSRGTQQAPGVQRTPST